MGLNEKNAHVMFEKFRNREKDTVVIMNEFSSLLPKNTSSILTLERIDAFLSEFDGINEGKSREKVFIIATTNDLSKVSDAVTRSERFDTCFEIGYPRFRERLKLFRMYVLNLKNKDESIVDTEIEQHGKKIVISLCKGFTGADFAVLMRKLQDRYKEKYRKNENAIITSEDLLECLNGNYFTRIRSNWEKQKYKSG